MEKNTNTINSINPVWQRSIERILGLSLGKWVVMNPYTCLGYRSNVPKLRIYKEFYNEKDYLKGMKKFYRSLESKYDFWGAIFHPEVTATTTIFFDEDTEETIFRVMFDFEYSDEWTTKRLHLVQDQLVSSLKVMVPAEVYFSLLLDYHITKEANKLP